MTKKNYIQTKDPLNKRFFELTSTKSKTVKRIKWNVIILFITRAQLCTLERVTKEFPSIVGKPIFFCRENPLNEIP